MELKNSRRSTNSVMIAAVAPISPSIAPSIRNGIRMNQFVAPTSRMIPISLRRANTPIRTVLPMSVAAEASLVRDGRRGGEDRQEPLVGLLLRLVADAVRGHLRHVPQQGLESVPRVAVDVVLEEHRHLHLLGGVVQDEVDLLADQQRAAE